MSSTRDFLALDCGASSGRGILGRFDGTRLELREVHRFTNGPAERNGHLHWNMPRLFQEMEAALGKAAAESDNLLGVGCDTWGQDHGFVNEAGELLDWPFCYQDKRTDGILETLDSVIPLPDLFSRTAAFCAPITTLCQLLATKASRPELLQEAEALLFIPGLIHQYLTGRRCADFTTASLSQLVSRETLDWDSSLVERLGLPVRLFPEILPPGSPLGALRPELAERLNIPPVPVYLPACHDSASAAVGVGLAIEGDLVLSSGTWSMLGMRVEVPITSPEALEAGCGNYGIPGPGWVFACGIMGLWYLDRFRREEWDAHPAVLTQLATDWEGEPCLFDPQDERFQDGESLRAVLSDWCTKTGQGPPDSPGAFVRCILESLALYYGRAIGKMEALAGRKVERILLVGGGSKNALLNQMTANATGRPVVTGIAETTAAGNILTQMVGSGAIASYDEAREVVAASFAKRTFEPEEPDAWQAKKARLAQLANAKDQS